MGRSSRSRLQALCFRRIVQCFKLPGGDSGDRAACGDVVARIWWNSRAILAVIMSESESIFDGLVLLEHVGTASSNHLATSYHISWGHMMSNESGIVWQLQNSCWSRSCPNGIQMPPELEMDDWTMVECEHRPLVGTKVEKTQTWSGRTAGRTPINWGNWTKCDEKIESFKNRYGTSVRKASMDPQDKSLTWYAVPRCTWYPLTEFIMSLEGLILPGRRAQAASSLSEMVGRSRGPSVISVQMERRMTPISKKSHESIPSRAKSILDWRSSELHQWW